MDKSYTAPANLKVINREFTKVIASKLSNDMRNRLAKPVSSSCVSLTVDCVTREASKNLEKSMEAYYQEGHVYDLDDQVAEEKYKSSKPSNSSEKATKDDKKQEYKQPFDPLLEAQIKQVQEGKEGDITTLGGISNKAKRPIYVYNKNGKLYKMVGKGLSGSPLQVQHVKQSDDRGHWQIPGDNSKVVVSGAFNCLYDVCTAQMSSEERFKANIQSGE